MLDGLQQRELVEAEDHCATKRRQAWDSKHTLEDFNAAVETSTTSGLRSLTGPVSEHGQYLMLRPVIPNPRIV